MDGYDDLSEHPSYNTPYHDPTMNPAGDASPWDLPDPRSYSRPRPRESTRLRRRSSVPRTLFASGSSSIFGSSPSMPDFEDQSPTQGLPALAVSPPSQENVTTLASGSGRDRGYEDEVRATVDRRRLPRVEKDADDPTTPPSSSRAGINRQESTTLTTLSRLFAVQAAVSPNASRSVSYTQPTRQPSNYTRNQPIETTGISDHLYTRGLLEGRHSDIAVTAFGHQYKLHRLVLDRAPFFRVALSEPWLEANTRETTVRPEEIDTSISQSSFELALKRLYGCPNVLEEDADAVGLFATGCWLEMQDLIDSSVESMLRQMTPETLSPLIRLVTNNYYGRAGDKILASAKAMLCRDGWKMPLRYWDGIPGDIIREIVGGDGFFINGEWDRWVLAVQLLDRRLKMKARENGLVEPGRPKKILKAPDTANLMAVRFDAVYRKNSINTGRGLPDHLYKWTMLYTHPDVEPILVLLDEGVHYIHLGFEQLQFIRRARDIIGLPVLPDKVVSNALWQQMELRQRVMNARDVDLELELSTKCTEDLPDDHNKDTTMSILTASTPPSSKGKHRADELPEEDVDSGSWDGNGKPRKFWIPSSDCNIVMGGNSDPVIATSNNTTLQRHASRLSATVQPEDIQWASDFTAVTAQPRPPTADGLSPAGEAASDVRYTHFPPFRFAAEFPNPRLLKEKKRVYSRTVFYAGSLWNIYIQKVASSRSKQLGVYLHRAKEREAEEAAAGTSGLAQGSVDERIGALEREMILRSERHERRQRRRTTLASDGTEADGGESSGSAGDLDSTLVGTDSAPNTSSAHSSAMRNLLSRSLRKSAEKSNITLTTTNTSSDETIFTPESDSESSSDDSENPSTIEAISKKPHVPTIPPYVDARPTIKTYFKIYSPSRGGRMLSVYESAPDKFNFSQSWGWKSSTLMLDEGLLGDDLEGAVGKDEDERQDAVGGGDKVGAGGRTVRGKGDGKLRFMVVIGNI